MITNDKNATIKELASLLSSLINYGAFLGAYENEITPKEIEDNIIKTCFSNVSYSPYSKDSFHYVKFAKFYRRKSSSGVEAYSSALYMSLKNNILSVSFPIHLHKRFVITLNHNERLNKLDLNTYNSFDEILKKLKPEILKNIKLRLKKYKLYSNGETEELLIKEQVKITEILAYE